MLERIARWAEKPRNLFESVATRIDAVGVVSLVLSITAAVLYGMRATTSEACTSLPVRIIDLELTFSARRYSTLMRWLAEHGCKYEFLRGLVTWDVVFPIAYASMLCAVFIWAERQRRFRSDGAPSDAVLPLRNHIFVLLPLLAGAIDILFENVPLWIAGSTAIRGGYSIPFWIAWILVVFGSLAAFAKFSLILISILALVAELLSGARGIVVKRLRYAMLAVLLGALPLLIIPQGQDILQRTVEGESIAPGLARTVIAIMFGAYVVWYCSRKLVQLKYPRDANKDSDWYDFYARQIPRMLGTAVIIMAAAAFARAGAGFVPFAMFAFGGFIAAALVNKFLPKVTCTIGQIFVRGNMRTIGRYDQDAGRVAIAILVSAGMLSLKAEALDFRRLRIVSYVLLVAAWLFYLYVYHRRSRIAVNRWKKSQLQRGTVQADSPALEFQRVDGEAVSSIDAEHRDRTIRLTLVIGSIMSIVALALFIWLPVPAARLFGALIVLSMFVATIVFYGSIATWVHERHGVPLAPIALVLAALFSIWNDSHEVRRVTGDQSAISRRPSISAKIDSWKADSAGRENGTMVLVAAAGGGLRAAYWTAMSLAVLQDAIPNFNRNLFAISSVSGGSVGASLYASLVRDARAGRGTFECASEPEKREGFTGCVRDFMKEDFLSPVLAKLVAPDFVQAFLPFPWTMLDRSLALEESWEVSYRGITKQGTMGERFLSLYDSTTSASTVPTLFLNTTHVETGKRYVMSPVTRGDTTPPLKSRFNLHDSEDLLRLIGSDLRLSTAAHNSARFAYVSPPGRIERNDTLEYGHIVDGGYFENSGLATLREILEAIREHDAAATTVVLYLCNDPLPCNAESDSVNPPTMPRAAVSEWLGPVRAIMSTRGARGSLSRADIADLSYVHFLQLNVCDSLIANNTPDSAAFALKSEAREERGRERVISPPLGWLLSQVARDWMDASLSAREPNLRPSACRMKNAAVVDRLVQILRPSMLRR